MSDSSLHTFIEDVAGSDHFRVQDDLGGGYVRLRAAEAQRRQAQQDIRCFEDVVIEMMRNARDADANVIFVATFTEGGRRFMTMIDDGSGIPKGMHETVFEPFVTSKLDSFHEDRWGVHGRGMALYSIKENVQDVHIVASEPHLGSVFAVEADLTRPGEKKDQSTLPAITYDESGKPTLRGPHNIARTVMEFALDERKQTVVYLGSPAEIVATLYVLGSRAALRSGTLLDTDSKSLPFYQRFGLTGDATELANLSASFGLTISKRTAHRILSDEIKALPSQLELFAQQLSSTQSKGKDSHTDKPATVRTNKQKLHISDEDLGTFKDKINEAYGFLAQAYYLNNDAEIDIKRKADSLVITIPLESSED